MPVTDIQRKYRYSVLFKIHSNGAEYSKVSVDEFTPPDKRSEPVTKQNRKLGQISLTGPVSYGEMNMRLALIVTGDASNATANLINDLQNMELSDSDTCNVTLSTLANIDGSEKVSYSQSYNYCRLTGLKIDALSRKGDDEMLHIELSLIPSKVNKVDVDGA